MVLDQLKSLEKNGNRKALKTESVRPSEILLGASKFMSLLGQQYLNPVLIVIIFF